MNTSIENKLNAFNGRNFALLPIEEGTLGSLSSGFYFFYDCEEGVFVVGEKWQGVFALQLTPVLYDTISTETHKCAQRLYSYITFPERFTHYSCILNYFGSDCYYMADKYDAALMQSLADRCESEGLFAGVKITPEHIVHILNRSSLPRTENPEWDAVIAWHEKYVALLEK